MNWLKRRIRNWINQDECIQEARPHKWKSSMISTSESEGLSSEPLRLSIYRANGGTIVETRVYDRQKDRNQTQLHIVGHDSDLGESLAKIITMESLRG